MVKEIVSLLETFTRSAKVSQRRLVTQRWGYATKIKCDKYSILKT